MVCTGPAWGQVDMGPSWLGSSWFGADLPQAKLSGDWDGLEVELAWGWLYARAFYSIWLTYGASKICEFKFNSTIPQSRFLDTGISCGFGPMLCFLTLRSKTRSRLCKNVAWAYSSTIYSLGFLCKWQWCACQHAHHCYQPKLRPEPRRHCVTVEHPFLCKNPQILSFTRLLILLWDLLDCRILPRTVKEDKCAKFCQIFFLAFHFLQNWCGVGWIVWLGCLASLSRL